MSSASTGNYKPRSNRTTPSFTKAYLLSDGEGFDNEFDIPASSIEVTTSGQLTYNTIYSETFTIPVKSGSRYPVIITSISSTTQSSGGISDSEIIVYKM